MTNELKQEIMQIATNKDFIVVHYRALSCKLNAIIASRLSQRLIASKNSPSILSFSIIRFIQSSSL